MEVSHTNLTEVTGMVLVDVGSVVVLTTGHTTTTGMLAVLADTTLTGGDVTAAVGKKKSVNDFVVFEKSSCFVLGPLVAWSA